MRKILLIVLFLIASIHFSVRISGYWNEYTKPFDPEYAKNRFEQSQWGPRPQCMRDAPQVNPETCIWDDTWYTEHKEEADKNFVAYKEDPIGDDELYIYVGWEYIQGHDPTLLNAEIPPLGKYLIGLSILAFNNPNVFALVSGILVLVVLYLLNLKLFSDKLLAFIPVTLFSFEPLFFTQIKSPNLDLLYLLFLLLTLFFFIEKRYIISSIFLGCMIATKSPISTFGIVSFALIAYLISTKHFNDMKKYLISLSIALAVFIFTYIRYFHLGHSIVDFVKVQKWILDFYSGGVKSYFDVWEILFTGSWHTWWDTYMKITEWNIFWPFSIGVLLLYWILLFLKKIKMNNFAILALWSSVYIVFLSVIPTWPRYLLLFLPFMYNLAVWLLSKSTPLIFLRR